MLAGALSVAALLALLVLRNDSGPAPTGAPPPPSGSEGYVGGGACATCHAVIADQYSRAGMGRSFDRLDEANEIADFDEQNEYWHAASRRNYRMYRRDGSHFMRRWQVGDDGNVTNVVERRIDYVLGSGLKARTYLSLTESGELLQLPVAWYSDRGGFWAMNPGYDRPDHDGFRRRVQHDCMFCHNAYPGFEQGKDRFDAEKIVFREIPKGIDCERCHGPGRGHVEAASRSQPIEAIRASVVNPARLSPARRLEICMQCHLQSTSTRLPYAVERAGRGVYSFRPGEPLGDYAIHFDHAPGSGWEDKFEIAHAAYRLLKSACYRETGGPECTDCHDPHRPLRDEPSRRRAQYRAVCQGCHADRVRALSLQGDHPASGSCVGCHMPQRRTEDVVHVIMTDHMIQRTREGEDLLSPLEERAETPEHAYAGEVVPYYPPGLPITARDELDLAVAQVRAGANLARGARRLAQLLDGRDPWFARYAFELAEALRRAGASAEAVAWYQRALAQDPAFLPAQRSYGVALAAVGRVAEAERVLLHAAEASNGDSRTFHNLGLVRLQAGRPGEAAVALRTACDLEPDSPDSHNALASALYELGDPLGAEREFREAVRLRPDYRLARANLAALLAATGRHREASEHSRWAREAPAQ
ncbi:MAG: tetratricopeptide repeat protein [Bryobacterales bacterium]|nr:tetratricopeptide repeat protein [Bryobacterales bacterium]